MSTLADGALVQEFLKGDVSLLSNQNLQVQVAFGAVQLLTKRGILLATLNRTEQPATVTVRYECDYWKLLHQLLAEHCFMLIGSAEQAGFMKYQERPIPRGYKMHCTEAKLLWRTWWTQLKSLTNRNNIQLDLLIFSRTTWYPVREIMCNQGTLFVKTLATEVALQSTDLVVWLQKETTTPIATSSQQEPAAATSEAVVETSEAIVETSSDASGIDPDRQSDLQALPDNRANLAKLHPAIAPPLRDLPVRRDRSPSSANQTVASPEPVTRQAVPAGAPSKIRPAAESDAEPAPQPLEQTIASVPDLSSVVRVYKGRLYIKTALGEVVVEGTDLEVWLHAFNTVLAKDPNRVADFGEHHPKTAHG